MMKCSRTAAARLLCLWMGWLCLLTPSIACGKVKITFYSHELGASFPHAFFTVKGTVDQTGVPVDANFGFTAKNISPAILMGSVIGIVEPAKPGYVRTSDAKFAVDLTDAQFAAVMAVVAKWQAIPGKSYNLNRRNCVHFVGEAAQAIGLRVVFDKNLMKKPRSFLENVIKLNPGLRL